THPPTLSLHDALPICATGQTGILIAGSGVPLDAVIADFISGAIEDISPARTDGGWDLIEGQGSLFHPSFAGVSTGLKEGWNSDRSEEHTSELQSRRDL